MTEREKMLAGMPYNCRDSHLLELQRKAREFMACYNAGYTTPPEKRLAMLQGLLEKVGDGVWIEPPVFFDFGCHISIGENSFVNFNCVFLDCGRITIGRNVLIAPAVQLYAVTHPIKVEERLPRTTDPNGVLYADITAPVVVCDNVWIGGGSIILPGVTIGEGTTIGAGSVVTKDVPPNVLALGNPCRVVREL